MLPILDEQLLCLWLFLPLAVCSAVPRTSSTHTYTRKDDVTGETLVCDMCPPGQHLLQHCSRSAKTRCGACPDNHFTEVWNYIDRCQYCSRFCASYEEESSPCSPTRNRECQCRQGYYSRHDTCFRHRKCPPGEGVTRLGRRDHDVTCAPCEEGLFSSESSSTKPCQNMSVCQANTTTIPGNDMHDVFCSQCKNGTKNVQERELCDRELMRFLAMQILPQRKEKRLHTSLKRKTRVHDQNASILDLLSRLKESLHGDMSFSDEVLTILGDIILPGLERKVKQWFN